jgi:hypothetical protein
MTRSIAASRNSVRSTSCTAIRPASSAAIRSASRPAIWALTTRARPLLRSTGSLAFLAIPFTANDNAPSLDHRAVDARDHAGRVGFSDFDEGVALLQIDLSDFISGNSAFSGDHAHEIADLYSVARADRHEQARHPSRRTSAGSRSLAFSGSRLCGGRRISFGRTPLRPLALQ